MGATAIEAEPELDRAMNDVLKDDTDLYRLFIDNEGFRRWMTDAVFELTYDQPSAP